MFNAHLLTSLFRGLEEVQVIGGVFIVKIDETNLYCSFRLVGSLPTAY
jgi:hypothetical protein